MLYRKLSERAPAKGQSADAETQNSPRAAETPASAVEIPVPTSPPSEEVVPDMKTKDPSEAPDGKLESTKEGSTKEESTKEENTQETIPKPNLSTTHTEAIEHSENPNMERLRRQMELVEKQLASIKTEITIQSGQYDGKSTNKKGQPITDLPPGVYEDASEQALIMESIKESTAGNSKQKENTDSNTASSSGENTGKGDPWSKYFGIKESTGKSDQFYVELPND